MLGACQQFQHPISGEQQMPPVVYGDVLAQELIWDKFSVQLKEQVVGIARSHGLTQAIRSAGKIVWIW